MDDFDTKIIRELQQNGRLSNQTLSERINLSPSPCLKRLRHLESTGMISGYTATVDQKAYGFPITAFVRIRLNAHSEKAIARFETEIDKIDEVQDCYLIAGEADYLLRIISESLSAYENFIRRRIQTIPGIASIDTSFAYGIVKKSMVYPHRNE